MVVVSEVIRREADRILQSGLLDLLGRYGDVHVMGSYALGLMTWRDLDIHLLQEHSDVEAFFRLGGEIAALLQPHRMHFRNESVVATPGLPRGLYWGVYAAVLDRGVRDVDAFWLDVRETKGISDVKA